MENELGVESSGEERRELPFISVIIPARNEANCIGKALAAIRAGAYPGDRYEIIVVDNGSTDETTKIAASCGARVLELKSARVSTSRNAGAREAKGEILAFLDADCLPCRTWLEAGVSSLSLENCLTGSIYDIPDDAPWIERDWFCQKETGRRETTHINAGNLFLRKELFVRLGGFNEQLATGEDTEFCVRAKAMVPVISDDRVSVVHLGNPKTAAQFLRREIWYGLGAFGSFKIDWKDKPLFGTILFSLFTLLQAVGVLRFLISAQADLLLLGIALVLLLLVLTVYYRRRFIKGAAQALRLIFLYYLFYLGRMISFWYLLTKKDYYHQIRKG